MAIINFKNMKKIIVVVTSIAFAVLAIALLFTSAKSTWLILLTVIVGALLLSFVWPGRYTKPATPASTVPNNELNRLYIIVLTGAVILFIFDMFTTTNQGNYASIIMITAFILSYAVMSIKKKFTVVEFLTLKAQDEREQYLIDATARRAYAFVRVLGLFFAMVLFSGLVKNFAFNATNVGFLVLVLIFATQFFFMYYLRKISK